MRRIFTVLAAMLAIVAAPAFAQQKSSAETRAMDHAMAMEKDIVAAFNKKDAAALAALYTRNATFVGIDGSVITGRAAIEANYVNTLKAWGDFKFGGEVKAAHAAGNGFWVVFATAVDGNGPNGPVKLRAHVVNYVVPVGKGWKVALTTVGPNVPPPAAAK